MINMVRGQYKPDESGKPPLTRVQRIGLIEKLKANPTPLSKEQLEELKKRAGNPASYFTDWLLTRKKPGSYTD